MASRYDSVGKFINNDDVYRNIFKDRGVTQIQQYGTRNLTYPTRKQIQSLKVADTYYGDPKMWWVIAFFNQKPTESLLRYGDLIYIPNPLERVLNYYGV